MLMKAVYIGYIGGVIHAHQWAVTEGDAETLVAVAGANNSKAGAIRQYAADKQHAKAAVKPELTKPEAVTVPNTGDDEADLFAALFS